MQTKQQQQTTVTAGMLTSREQEITSLVSVGLSNKQVARQLNVAEGTVKSHLHKIYGKSGVKNRTALAALLNR